MTVSHLTRSRGQLWSDLVGELGGSGSYLTLSEEELIAAAVNTYGGSVSAKTTGRADLIASLVNAAGGSVSSATHSEGQMMAALANALGGSVSALTGSFNSSLAASVNAAASEGGGGAPEWLEDLQIPGGGDLPSYAASFADEEYWDGEEGVLADLFTGISEVEAGGLSVDQNSLEDNEPSGSAALVAYLNGGTRVIFVEFSLSELPDGETHYIFELLGADLGAGGAGAEVYLESGAESRPLTITAYEGGYDNATEVATTGVHRLAVCWNGADFIRASLNGSTIAVAAAGANPITIETFALGASAANDFSSSLDKSDVGHLITAFAVYPSQTQSDMNALTAL